MHASEIHKFQLYTVENTQNSSQALLNLQAICKAYIGDHYEIEIVEVFQQPQRAKAMGIRLTPTLIRSSPLPTKRIVGTLSQTERVLAALGIEMPPH
jgi:circadian clock protein KaiB